MSEQRDKAEKMAKEAGVPLDNVYTTDEFAKSIGDDVKWMTTDRWNEIAAEQAAYNEEYKRNKKAKE